MSNKEKLRNAGLRPTKQRIIVANLLLNGKNRHFTAEDLQNDIIKLGEHMSLATVYNCLNNFKKVGIIKQVESLGETAVFDTNISHHHHFMNEETGELIDFDPTEINLNKLPKIPPGYVKSGLDVIIKLRKNT
tara:strand:+ start:329 stop:727 length:399 start_codon:yes stop_codon:yes gene_type:complete